MQIGFVTSETIVVDGKETSWNKMTIRAPFARQQDYKITKHNGTREGEPDFDIYLLVNNKGEKFRNPKVGALWLKRSEKGEEYMSGNIESPVVCGGKIYIALVKARALYEGEVVGWKYDVLYSPPRDGQKIEKQNYPSSSIAPVLSEAELNELLMTEAEELF